MADLLQPGRNGALGSEINQWRKGLVYTAKRDLPSLLHAGEQCRITASFKKKYTGGPTAADFGDLYRRVYRVAAARIEHLTCSRTGELLRKEVLCHGWRTIGDTNEIATSFITIGLFCSEQEDQLPRGLEPPSTEALRSPGGATLDELTRLVPQRADEIYNEFDFTESSTASSDPITLSYGEAVPCFTGIDFTPFVQRAETLAGRYHALLKSFGEISTGSLTILGREWFNITNPNLVTVQVYFEG